MRWRGEPGDGEALHVQDVLERELSGDGVCSKRLAQPNERIKLVGEARTRDLVERVALLVEVALQEGAGTQGT
jgi:hypothetical protein